MYCPRCGVENTNEASFCRACGADISLVPQALTGRTEIELDTAKRSGGWFGRNKKDKPVTYEKAYENLFIGLAFFLISFAVMFIMPGGNVWGFWLLIPAFACAGEGYGQIQRLRQEQRAREERLAPPATTASRLSGIASTAKAQLPARDTSEVKIETETHQPQASVTEGTTRLLDESAEPVRAPSRIAHANRE
jgi:ribosomal protein L37E